MAKPKIKENFAKIAVDPFLEEVQDYLDASRNQRMYQNASDELMEWARQKSDRLSFTALSLISGRYDDIYKDIRNGKISIKDVIALVNRAKKTFPYGESQFGHIIGKIDSGLK